MSKNKNRLVHDLAQEERAPKVPLLITMIITFSLHNIIMHDDTSSHDFPHLTLSTMV
jgi:hypothetical protein